MTIPEGRLSEAARARRRAELMAAVATDRGHRSWRAPLAVAAVVAAVGGTAYGVAALGGSDGSELAPAGTGSERVEGTDWATDGPAPSDTARPDTALPEDGTCASPPPTGPRKMMRQQQAEYRAHLPVVQGYRDVLAAHLDPEDRHLERRASNVQSSGLGCDLAALGTEVGWTAEGEGGTGMVRVEVSAVDEPTQVEMSHEGWRPLRLDVDGVTAARQVDYDGGFAVEVERADGLTVAVEAGLLFGNNATDPVSGFPFDKDNLVEVALDPALQLPAS